MLAFLFVLAAPSLAAPPSWIPDARFSLALYCDPSCGDEVIDALDQALGQVESRRRLPSTAKEPLRVMGLTTADDFGRPDVALLGSLADGVSAEDEAALAASQEVLVANFASPQSRIQELTSLAWTAFLAQATAHGGVVEELETGRLYGVQALEDRAAQLGTEPLDVSSFLVLEVSGEEDQLALSTLGLGSLGLHELQLQGLAEDQLDDHAALVNAVAQLAWEQGGLSSRAYVSESALELPAARYQAIGIEGTVWASNTQPLWSTSTSTVASLRFEGRFDAEPLESYEFYAQAGLAPPADEEPEPARAVPRPVEMPPEGEPAAPEPVAVPTPAIPAAAAPAPPVLQLQPPPEPAEPPEPPAAEPEPPLSPLEAAIRQAAERLDGPVREAWRAGLPEGDRLFVKAPFAAQDGSLEYLWLQVEVWEGDQVRGVLRSEPSWIDDMQPGDQVEVPREVIFDYLWRRADGTADGNGTEPFLR